MQAIQETEDYSMFRLLPENRAVNLKKPQTLKLAESMVELGWLDAYPALVTPAGDGSFFVVDGQHRIAIAQDLGLPVKYVITDKAIDIAGLNDTQAPWNKENYLNKYAVRGVPAYVELKEFIRYHPVSLSVAIRFLGGILEGGATRARFRAGLFTIDEENRVLAHRAVKCYEALIDYYPGFKRSSTANLLYKLHQIDGFKPEVLLKKASMCHLRRIRGSSETDMLEQLEEIYNRHSRTRWPMISAIQSFNANRVP